LNFQAIVGTGIPGCSGIYTIGQGEDFEIMLESNPSTGYRCELSEEPRPGIIILVKEEFIASTSTAVGAPGSQVFTFQGYGAGRTPLNFWYVRSFDSPPVPTNEISFMVIVG
jgi:predicted secreted protein